MTDSRALIQNAHAKPTPNNIQRKSSARKHGHQEQADRSTHHAGDKPHNRLSMKAMTDPRTERPEQHHEQKKEKTKQAVNASIVHVFYAPQIWLISTG